ncbi:MAG: pyridoxal phosphate-dependent aminotransferase [Alphaproteobacteria bacterium]|nr:pyridoxal phosphate-dependent aminotransferase [Rickettsiales bacterium]
MLSNRVKQLAPSPTIAMATKAKEMIASGIKVIDLSLGDPVLDPSYCVPQHIKDAAIDALNNKMISYTASAGLPELRQAIVDSIKRYNGLEYSIKDVSVGSGAKQLIFNSFLATINHGDEVILPCPAWVSYYDVATMFGAKCVKVHTLMENDLKITPKELEAVITPKTKWLVINSPSNPTGAIYTKEELKGIADVLLKYPNILVMSDDIYQHLIFDQDMKFYNILMVEPLLRSRTIIIDGVAKSHGMTGWRIGYGISSNIELISKINNVQSQSTSNACTIAQYAAIAALKDDNQTAKLFIKNIAKRKKIFIDGITDSRVKMNDPKGAFYVFAMIEDLIGKKWNDIVIESDSVFCELALNQYHVALAAGSSFGMDGYFRASLASSAEDIKTGAEKLNQFCKKIK